MKKVLIVFWDWWWKRGTPEWWDSWATVADGAIGYTLLKFI